MDRQKERYTPAQEERTLPFSDLQGAPTIPPDPERTMALAEDALPHPPAPPAAAFSPAAEQKLSRGRRIALLCAGGALALMALGFLLLNSRYAAAEAYAAEQAFAEGLDALSGVPTGYRDSRMLRRYLRAGEYMQAGELGQAKESFRMLGGYLDAPAMLQECDYREALALIEARQFDDARDKLRAMGEYANAYEMLAECDYQEALFLLEAGEREAAQALFERLALQGYGDAEEMIAEADYQEAVALHKAGRLEESLRLLESIAAYEKAAIYLPSVRFSIYERAAELFTSTAAFNDSLSLFALIPDYQDSGVYIDYLSHCWRYVEEPGETLADFVRLKEEVFQEQIAFFDWELCRADLLDFYIEHFLRGNWNGDGAYFHCIFFFDQGNIAYLTDIPHERGRYAYVEDLAYLTGDEAQWNEQMRFSVLDKNTIDVYCVQDGRVYRLTREEPI